MNACPKQYQLSPVKDLSQHKPGPSRILSLEDEILMTLMRIRLDCPVKFLHSGLVFQLVLPQALLLPLLYS